MDQQRRMVEEFLVEARVHLRFGLYEEAGEALDGALGLDPESEGAHRLMIRLREATGAPQLAITSMLEVAHNAYRRGDESEAVALWRRILELQPKHPTARSRLGLTMDQVVRAPALDAQGAKFAVQIDNDEAPDNEVFDPGAEFLGDFLDDDDDEGDGGDARGAPAEPPEPDDADDADDADGER